MNWNKFDEVGAPEKNKPCLVYKPNNPYCKYWVDEWVDLYESPVSWSSATICVGEGWAECEKARTLIELRKALNLYGVALRANFYTDEDIAEYVEMIDEQDRELRRLREYKRIQDELFGIMTEDDEELHQVIQANKMREMGLSDAEICKTLNLTRNRLNYLRRKIEVENVHGSVEF